MARLIMFSDYLKANEKEHVLENLEYIATREGVEINDAQEDTIARLSVPLNESTAKHSISSRQEKMIHELTDKYSDLTELPEYETLNKNKNMYTASLFISEAMNLLEEMSMQNERYMKYISERPGVVKNENIQHGLFDQCGAADFKNYQELLSQHKGNVYRDIISLNRNDAKELGFENQREWKQLLQLHMHQKADLLGVPQERFKWVAAFHNEGHHPHCHVMSWDAENGHIFQDQNTITKFKSILANDIFKNEMWLAKEYKSELRDVLEEKVRTEIQRINTNFNKVITPQMQEQLESKLIHLSTILPDTGSHYYAYQNEEVKIATKNILASVLQTKELRPLLDQFIKSQVHLASFYQKDLSQYTDQFAKSILDPGKKDRKVMHNLILNAAYEIKQQQFEAKLLRSPHITSLNQKINDSYDIDHRYYNSDQKQARLTDAMIRYQQFQEKPMEQIIPMITKIIPNEETVLERILTIHDKETPVSQKDIRLLTLAFQEKGLAKDMQMLQQNSFEGGAIHTTARLFYGLINYMSSNTASNEQQAARLRSVHREDEYLLLKAKQKNQ